MALLPLASPPAEAGLRQWFAGSFTALGTTNSTAWRPCPDHTQSTVTFKATRNGTFKVQNKDSAGNWNDIVLDSGSATITHVANTQDLVYIYASFEELRVAYTDTSNNTGTFLVEFKAACE